MAYLSEVTLNDVQVKGAHDAAKYGKFGLNEIASMGAGDVDYLMPEALDQLRTIGSNINVDSLVLKDQVVEVRTAASFDIPSNLADYTKIRYTPYDLFSGIKIFPSTYKGSMANMEKDVQTRILRVMRDMGKAKEGILQTILEANKTQVLNYTTQASQNDGTYSFAANTLSISKAAQQSNMFFMLQNLMESNEEGGNYDIATSPMGIISSIVAGNQNGANNAKNYGWDNVPASSVFESNQIDAASDNFNGWFIKKGALATIDNHPYDFQMNTQIGEMKWSVSDVEMPFVNSRPNIFINKGATNSQSLVSSSDNIMASFEEMGFWVRFYVVTPYNEDASTIVNPIVKLKGLTS